MLKKLIPNKVVKYLILSDLAFWTGWGLLSPIFAIFIVQKIQGGNALVVGLAAAIFWLSRALFRVPIGIFLDKFPAEKDDYFSLVIGLLIASLTPFGYVSASLPWHIYVLEFFHGIGLAMSLAGWSPIFTRHIDKGKESTEWGLSDTSLSIGIGVAGALGGWTITRYGFRPVFLATGCLGLLGAFSLFGLKNEVRGLFEDGFKRLVNGQKKKKPKRLNHNIIAP